MKVYIRDIEDGRFSQAGTIPKDELNFSDESLKTLSDFQIILAGDKFEKSFLLTLTFEGIVQTSCDRCLEDLSINLKDSCKIMMSYDNDLTDYDHEDFDEVIQLVEDDIEVDISTVLVECIELAIPMKRVHEDKKNCVQFDHSESNTQSLANNPELEKLKKMFNS